MADTQAEYGVLRLKSKDARAAIVKKLATDFNLGARCEADGHRTA